MYGKQDKNDSSLLNSLPIIAFTILTLLLNCLCEYNRYDEELAAELKAKKMPFNSSHIHSVCNPSEEKQSGKLCMTLSSLVSDWLISSANSSSEGPSLLNYVHSQGK